MIREKTWSAYDPQDMMGDGLSSVDREQRLLRASFDRGVIAM
jgi:hypothetical protein